MAITKQYVYHQNSLVPRIVGSKGGGKGGDSSPPVEAPNSLFSTDILFVTVGLGEGPIYRINPNGPQDIQIQDSTIDDLLNIDGNGLNNTERFVYSYTTGTTNQGPLRVFGETVATPQNFGSAVKLKNGNLSGIPSSSVTLQDTSISDWDALSFTFQIDQLAIQNDKGDTNPHSLSVSVQIFDRLGSTVVASVNRTIHGKTTTPFKFTLKLAIPEIYRSLDGYRFTIRKTSGDSDSSKVADTISVLGWVEIENSPQAYPRTAVIGYAIKAENEHTGGVPSFTSLVKGLLVKVPSNYNQPILSNGEIDWRELETDPTFLPAIGYTLQKTGTGTVLSAVDPQIYVGTWDGTFVYSWTQNPVWVLYDILTNKTYGLGLPEANIDKFRFYQIAQYCDACDSSTGKFNGVKGMADGSFRSKPRGQYTAVRENQVGMPRGTVVQERRFICDLTIAEQKPSIDLLNALAAAFRAAIIYSGGKISLAIDMPDEFPVMLFNEANIKEGTFQIKGTKESEILTGIDISYIEPSNHFRREVVRIDATDANDGSDVTAIENIASLELMGVTRRSQAMRAAQYQLAATKYIRRSITFGTGTEALYLSPGDVIAVASQGTGIAYGFGGKVIANSAIGYGSDTNVTLEHFTVPSLTNSTFTANTDPLALRIIRMDSDQMDIFLISNTNFELFNTGNVSSGSDTANVRIMSKYDPIAKTISSIGSGGLQEGIAPRKGDLWSLGEFEHTDNSYSNKSGKLFKISDIGREPEDESFIIGAVEYISNIYVDSDTFINYEPTAYTDIESSLTTPPTPIINFKATPRRRIDGSVAVDGIIEERNDRVGYGQSFKTIYEVSRPAEVVGINTINSINPVNITVDNIGDITNNTTPVTISGKNGFVSTVGQINLLCNTISLVDTAGGTLSGNIEFTIDGLENCFDKNFYKHVLEVNDGGIFGNLKGSDHVTIPVIEKSNTGALLGFVGHNSTITNISREISGYDINTNTLKIENLLTNGLHLSDVLPQTPFYININQLLDSRYFNNNSFFVEGTSYTYTKDGAVNTATGVATIEVEIAPIASNFVRLTVDGILKSDGQYVLNINKDLAINANIQYATSTSDGDYHIEIDHYTVPIFEIGDNVEASAGSIFSVAATTFDESSSEYNVAMTANCVYRIDLASRPASNLTGLAFTNIATNPVGVVGNVSGTTMSIDYDPNTYAGNFNLANSRVYDLQVGGDFDRLLLTNDLIIKDLNLGVTTLRARNKSMMGRISPAVTKSITVTHIPIQKVTNLSITESLYREQTGGVAVRATLIFDHIENQDVTDYEISYKLDNVASVGTDDGGTDLTSFNTVKVSASGVDSLGKIRFTVNGLNRGITSETNSITFRVTPLNRTIRGATTNISKPIVGKSAKPQNVSALTGGQQTDQITLFWQYARVNGELADLDLKEVVFRRAPGVVTFTVENYIGSDPFVTVSAGTARKSIPIDTFGTFTYLARTRDTSGNFSDSVTGISLTTTKPQRATTVAAYSEDSPSVQFSTIVNNNASEDNFPSYSDSNTGGIAYSYTSAVDNANGSSSGWSAIGGSPTDILAIESADYITQIRDFGSVVTGSIQIELEATQEIESTYNDQHEEYLESVSEISNVSSVLVDVDFGGIGHILGFANASITTSRYDTVNKTWMTGPANGNVWGIWNHGQFVGDISNANSYALIAGVINANAIALGASYYANGDLTGSNAFSNVTAGSSTYTLVNFIQYSDTGQLTYAGDLGAISTQTFVRTSSSEDLYYANGNVDISKFDAASTNNGFIPYEAGTKSFRYFQIKFAVNNTKPDEFDFTIDKFRYTIDKEQTVYTDTVNYDSSPKTVSFTNSAFITRPVISYAVLDSIDSETNPPIIITTAASNTSLSFKLLNSNGAGGEYAANSTANIMITIVGV
jgi:hypothetical protein